MTFSSSHHHPEQPVRHSYPLSIDNASIGTALSLLLRTLPYAAARFGVLLGLSVATIVWILVTFGGGSFLGSKIHPWAGYAWVIAGLGTYGYLWWLVVRYFLYLLKCGHVAVLTELMVHGGLSSGSQSMFAYGKDVVTKKFGQVNALFALDLLVHGVVRALNRTLSWVANLLPIPGLGALASVVNAIVYASTTYIDETIFSYGLARGDADPWRSAKDGLIYYAQNTKEVLKTGVWIVVFDKVLTTVIWVVMLAPAFLLGLALPDSLQGSGTAFSLLVAALLAANIRSAFLKPLFLIMVMAKFHTSVQGQAIDLEWDERLSRVSKKFQTIRDRSTRTSPRPFRSEHADPAPGTLLY